MIQERIWPANHTDDTNEMILHSCYPRDSLALFHRFAAPNARSISSPQIDAHKKSLPAGLTLHMKSALPLLVALVGSLALPLCAEDAKPLLNQPGKVITQPDFKQPLGGEWSVGKGKWVPAEGLLAVTDIPDEK